MPKTRVVGRPIEADGLLIIDASNLVHRSFHAYSELKDKTGRPSGHIYGSVRLLLSTLANDLDTGSWCLAFGYDGPGAKEARRQTLPSYKMNRDPSRFNPVPSAMEVLRAVPGLHVIQEGKEGDDAVAWLAGKAGGGLREQKVVILSGDKDLWSLLRYPNVQVFSPNLKRYVMQSDILKEYHVEDPAKISLAKALFGDSSDGIKGVERLIKKQVAPTMNLAAVQDVNTFYQMICSAPVGDMSEKTLAKLRDNEAVVHQNYDVILPRTEGFGPESVKLTKQTPEAQVELVQQLRGYDCNGLVETLGPLFGA